MAHTAPAVHRLRAPLDYRRDADRDPPGLAPWLARAPGGCAAHAARNGARNATGSHRHTLNTLGCDIAPGLCASLGHAGARCVPAHPTITDEAQ